MSLIDRGCEAGEAASASTPPTTDAKSLTDRECKVGAVGRRGPGLAFGHEDQLEIGRLRIPAGMKEDARSRLNRPALKVAGRGLAN
jgi:hypothetical protein